MSSKDQRDEPVLNGKLNRRSILLAGSTLAAASALSSTASLPDQAAMLSGPREITKDAAAAEMGADGNLVILRQGTNDWVCFPGDENEIGNVPMCADPMGSQWMMDIRAKKPKPTNTALGLIYMLCGATQPSNTDPFDRTSPAIPIGAHWMIIWPYDAKRCGLPNTVRDAGAWMMCDGTPYAYLHICGTPWVGKRVRSRSGPDLDDAIWQAMIDLTLNGGRDASDQMPVVSVCGTFRTLARGSADLSQSIFRDCASI